jgi:hypothetical protein
MAQNENGLSARARASPTRKQMVTGFAILDNLNLRTAFAKLPGKPVGELIKGLLLIRRAVRVYEPSEPLNHLRLKRPKKWEQVAGNCFMRTAVLREGLISRVLIS